MDVRWQAGRVQSPNLDRTVRVVVARNIPYTQNANRLQNLSIYLPESTDATALVGKEVTSIPTLTKYDGSSLPQCQVHVHGGAWRDPNLLSTSIEAAVAHTFSAVAAEDTAHAIKAIVSINYTLSPFPTHPDLPYDPIKNNHSDPGREAVHPQHVHDVLHALSYLRSFGLEDNSYILSGHSAGSCLVMQSLLFPPQHWAITTTTGTSTLEYQNPPPLPAAILGMNGLYDLPALVHNLGPSHSHLSNVYADLIGIAYGTSSSSDDEQVWSSASPTQCDLTHLTTRLKQQLQKEQTCQPQRGNKHHQMLIVLDQSPDDQLVPMNQTDALETALKTQLQKQQAADNGLASSTTLLRVIRGRRCTGRHAAPWEEGYMIADGVRDVLDLLS